MSNGHVDAKDIHLTLFAGGHHEHVRRPQEIWRRYGAASFLSTHVLTMFASGLELVTPSLDGMILPGVTRDSVLAIAREHASGKKKIPGLADKLTVSERPISMKEILTASKKGALVDLFGSGSLGRFSYNQPLLT